MIGLDLLGADDTSDKTKNSIKAAAPSVIDTIWDAFSGKKKDAPKKDDTKDKKPPKEEESFLEGSLVGPVKVWHALATVVAGGAAWLLWPKGKK